ncbi:MAG TPA: UDP-N-acetylmuramoyl-tripeptide--D-alanyl-D-alanine ligase [Verrucomicrobiae bacterium]|nr:UDP-N-acetylmuramoyl-tripeptide--D-alanyl-D-alanine ligase [Verrucomicrobiae bacterium]
METLRLEQLAELCEAQLIRGEPDRLVSRISIDSRALSRGDCFVALRGPRFDGHDFVSDVARLGASAAVVSNPTRAMNSPSALALLQVQDTLTALHKLATNYRRLMPPTTRLVAVTGSSGKTTTKQLIAAVLGERFNVVESTGNNNNQIGVPLNLLRLERAHNYGVFELGTSRPGEIPMLADMVKPDIGVITNIGLGHVEALGDEAGVAREKGALFAVLPRNGDGLAVINADDKWHQELRMRTNSTVVTIGIENFADIRASEIKINGDVKFRLNIAKKREDVIVRLKTLGRHQIYNALQAAAVGYFAGLDLDEIRLGLENASFPRMRMEPVTVEGVKFVNDCYNANVVSMKAALQMIRETPCPRRKIAVLGDMLELGEWTQSAHGDVGAMAANCGLSLLVTVGQSARLIAQAAVEAGMETHRVMPLGTAEEAGEAIHTLAHEGDLVLVKGSRRLQLERIVEEYRSHMVAPL